MPRIIVSKSNLCGFHRYLLDPNNLRRTQEDPAACLRARPNTSSQGKTGYCQIFEASRNSVSSGAKNSNLSRIRRYRSKPALPAPSKISTNSISTTLIPRQHRQPFSTPKPIGRPIEPQPRPSSSLKLVSKIIKPQRRPSSTPQSVSKIIKPPPRPSSTAKSISKITKPQPQRRQFSATTSARKLWFEEQRLTAWGHDPKGIASGLSHIEIRAYLCSSSNPRYHEAFNTIKGSSTGRASRKLPPTETCYVTGKATRKRGVSIRRHVAHRNEAEYRVIQTKKLEIPLRKDGEGDGNL